MDHCSQETTVLEMGVLVICAWRDEVPRMDFVFSALRSFLGAALSSSIG
jgi:hypothetical protein